MPSGRLSGLSILIVGGTAGIGLSAARACLREGSNLTVVGRSDEYLKHAISELGPKCRILTSDAADPAAAEQAVAEAITAFGQLDGSFTWLVAAEGGSAMAHWMRSPTKDGTIR